MPRRTGRERKARRKARQAEERATTSFPPAELGAHLALGPTYPGPGLPRATENGLLGAVLDAAIQRSKVQAVVDALLNTAANDKDPKVRISAARAVVQFAGLQLKSQKAKADMASPREPREEHVHLHLEPSRPELSTIAAKFGVDIVSGESRAG